MKHLAICDYGTFLGLSNERLMVKNRDDIKCYPLNRLHTVSVVKQGVSISGDLIGAFSKRGIKLFFLDFRGVPQAAILGESQHGVVATRLAQMRFCHGDVLNLAKQVVVCKIKNQRAVLNYVNKYHRHDLLASASKELLVNIDKAKYAEDKEVLLGYEGASAKTYFGALNGADLLSSTFSGREGRGSQEINNSMLNLGYAILSSYILSAVVNAGLEAYLGFLHAKRPGRMALVLDIMEEYRAWVVDRAVIKLRSQSEGQRELTPQLKKILIGEIQNTCKKKYLYRKRRVALEQIIQRQIYRLCGYFHGKKNYKSYLFKW